MNQQHENSYYKLNMTQRLEWSRKVQIICLQ